MKKIQKFIHNSKNINFIPTLISLTSLVSGLFFLIDFLLSDY